MQNKTISKFGIWLTMILSEKKKYGLQENKNKISEIYSSVGFESFGFDFSLECLCLVFIALKLK